jgi:hypothetical protein
MTGPSQSYVSFQHPEGLKDHVPEKASHGTDVSDALDAGMLKCFARLDSTVRLLFFLLVSIAGVLDFNMASRLRSFDVRLEVNVPFA